MASDFSAEFPVEVIRSPRRKKSVSARFVGNVLQVRVPAGLPVARERELVEHMVAKVGARRTSVAASDEVLLRRAEQLNDELLQSRARVTSVRWVSNQNTRWASCTQDTAEIRVSDRLRGVPGYVLDAVLVHELVHTFIPGGHTKEFWQWADKAPHAERAKGFLEAWERMPHN